MKMSHSNTATHGSAKRGSLVRNSFFSGLVLISTGCAAGQQQSQAPAQTSDEVVTFMVPSVRAVEKGSETQEKKQVIAALIPLTFTVSDKPTKDCVKGPEESKGLLGGLIKVDNGQTPKRAYVITTRTGMDYEPKTLAFRLRITNHSEKVMHLGDLYLKVNINSQEVEVSKLDLDNIKAGVLLKGDSKDFTVSIPSWNKNSPEATVDFSLQNVPIELDAKGDAIDRGDFSWVFKAQNETKQASTKKTVENLMLDAAEASSMQCHPGAVAAN